MILSSGYSEETATGRFAGLGLAGFIQKPYQLDTMIATLREAVGGERGNDSSGLRTATIASVFCNPARSLRFFDCDRMPN